MVKQVKISRLVCRVEKNGIRATSVFSLLIVLQQKLEVWVNIGCWV